MSGGPRSALLPPGPPTRALYEQPAAVEPAKPSAAAQPQRLLLLADAFQLAYRVLRCARATGAEVYVLGNPGATALRSSRHCQRFFPSACIIHGQRDPALALDINCLVREYGISLVMPADAPSTRSLIASRDLIQAPCFPLPSLAEFDLLNDKWGFAGLCLQLDIRHPNSTLFSDTTALARAIATSDVKFPVVAKPLSMSGGVGIVLFDGTDTEQRLRAINYQPILLQDFIAGEPIGASIYAHRGRIEAFIAHHYRRRVYTAFPDDQIYYDLEKIVAHCALTGVYNFDMILTPDGAVYYLECNPRFFYKINLSMIAGINFVAHGLAHIRNSLHPSVDRSIVEEAVRVRFPEALLLSLLRHRPTARDWAMAAYLYSDPVPYLLEKLKLTV
jgi:ribosomal protein S6-L-glutamate ligase RimK-like protein